MDLEDFFEAKRKPHFHHYKEHRDHEPHHDYRQAFYHNKHEYQYSNRHDQKQSFDWQVLLAKINNNPLVKVAAIATVSYTHLDVYKRQS